MRDLILALLLCTLGLRLGAAEQLITVTPQTLADWSVVGADRTVLAAEKQLSIPAGAQLSREFSTAAVIMHLCSRPVFSETAADWPILEIGPVALALVGRDQEAGRLVLVANEDSVVDLPWPVVADNSNPTVDLILAYDPMTGAGLIAYQDKLKSFTSAVTTKLVEVVLSAGEHAAWPQDTLQVLLLSEDPPPGVGPRAGADNAYPHAAITKLKAALDRLPGPAHAAKSAGATQSAVSTSPAPVPVSTLEIFTPPAVRRGRAEEIRTLLARIRAR